MQTEQKTGILKPDFIAHHYRGVIVTLVMVNTALIMFLIVYIWLFSPSIVPAGSAEPIAAGVVKTDRLIMWSKPGGLEHGAESRGVVEQESRVEVLRGQRLDQTLWLEVTAGDRRGWIPESEVDYGKTESP
jgi:hypothetical protein